MWNGFTHKYESGVVMTSADHCFFDVFERGKNTVVGM
jgi:hypothetical protein